MKKAVMYIIFVTRVVDKAPEYGMKVLVSAGASGPPTFDNKALK